MYKSINRTNEIMENKIQLNDSVEFRNEKI